MLSQKQKNLQKKLNLSIINHKKAFFGYITKNVRNKALLKIPNIKGTLIDIATGNALLLFSLDSRYSHSFKLIGLDLSEKNLIEAKKLMNLNNISNIDLIHGDALKLPINDESVDVLLCLNTFLNINDLNLIQNIFKEFSRVLNPNGKIIFDIRNKSNILLSIKYFFHSIKKTFYTKAYTISDFQKILSEINLDIIEKDYIGINSKYLSFGYLLSAKKIEK